MKNNLISYFSKSSLLEITKRSERWVESDYYKQLSEQIQDGADFYEQLFEQFCNHIEQNVDNDFDSEKVFQIIQEEFEKFSGCLGVAGTIILAAIAIAGSCDGSLINEIFDEADPKIIQFASKAIKTYAKRRFDEMFDEVVEIIVDNIDIIGADFSDSNVLILFERLKQLCMNYLGITKDEEYRVIIELLPEDFFGKYDKVLYLVDVVKHFTERK